MDYSRSIHSIKILEAGGGSGEMEVIGVSPWWKGIRDDVGVSGWAKERAARCKRQGLIPKWDRGIIEVGKTLQDHRINLAVSPPSPPYILLHPKVWFGCGETKPLAMNPAVSGARPTLRSPNSVDATGDKRGQSMDLHILVCHHQPWSATMHGPSSKAGVTPARTIFP